MLALLDGDDVSLLSCWGDCRTQPQCLRLSNQTNAQFLLSWDSSPTRISLSSVPFFNIPSWVSYHHSLFPWLGGSALCPLPVLIHSINNWAHLSRPPSPTGRPTFNSSLCWCPAGKRSNSVSAYGILQETCYLLTVLLQVKRTCLRPPKKSKIR